jgi:hypothetical protein
LSEQYQQNRCSGTGVRHSLQVWLR